MRPFGRHRVFPRRLQVLLAGLMLAFALNAIAHVSHTHDVSALTTSHLSCGYCAHFGGLAGTPSHVAAPSLAAPTTYEVCERTRPPVIQRPERAAQPRAPPVS